MQIFLIVFILLSLIIWASKDKQNKNKKTSDTKQYRTRPTTNDYYSILEVSKVLQMMKSKNRINAWLKNIILM